MKKICLITTLLVLNVVVFSQITDSYWEKLATEPEHFDQIFDAFDMYMSTTYPDSILQDKLENIDEYVAGAMHKGTYRYENRQWDIFAYCDGGDCEVNWNDPGIYYYTQVCGSKNTSLLGIGNHASPAHI